MPTILDIQSLNKNYGDLEVLHDMSIAMQPGDFLVLLGASGCGKSTLLNCIAGLEEITSGSLKIDGRDVAQVPPKDRDIAMVFQSYALYPTMTVGENITFGMKVRGEPRQKREAEAQRVAEVLQIDHLLSRKPAALSGGQRQRVAIGRALVRDPKLFLFDEPLSNLDALLRVEMRAEIKRLHREFGASIVYVTHDQIEAMALATKICVLKDGAIQQVGTPDQVYNSPANTFVAGFIGSPPMNLLPAQATGTGMALAGDPSLTVDLNGLATGENDLTFGVRPEDLEIVHTDDGRLSKPLQVADIEDTGADLFVTLNAGQQNLTARSTRRSGIAIGDMVGLSFDAARTHLFAPDGQLAEAR
ncbi:ABC transporter ATP-binding protein [Actibacterium sp. 188UL27-1]|uniref:ABC transporter ATP-binding protein n=1 Tax=Actibacterium sp. 188UL27-1 TaxID=2786961 RepID=UPI00195C3367|nr:ABC transporter ATP-binding protein [Actibacterium sp. 188UL27-1]MBM7069157.1 ABC transporter ATP-binding protein [Actibacterium sp. 188UL27-1]